MANPPETSAKTLKHRACAVRERFEAEGVNVSEWARQRGFDIALTHRVLTGDRACRRGMSHRIAVALGLKDEPVQGSTVAEPLEGFRA